MSVPEISLDFPNGIKSVTFKTGLFINNQFQAGAEGKTIDIMNPTLDKKIGVVSEASAADVDIAVDAAEKAYNTVWGERCSAAKRGKMLMELADAFEANGDTIAAIESTDNGKAFTMARYVDLQGAADCLRYYAGWADKNSGQVIETDNTKMAYTRHEPLGVVGQIIPWNFPILMFAWKLGPALATGNTIVIKVAETTPLSALFVATLIEKIFPPGVVNIITGYGAVAGAAISSHMKIAKVAFTGSTLVGRQIMKAAAMSNLKSVTLELGGKSPNIIFDDADLEQAVGWAAFGIFFNHGQTCCAGSRVFVQEGVYDKFVDMLTKKVQSIKVGDPFAQDTFQGPQTSKLQFDRITEHIQSGKDEGATVHIGGERHGSEGYFIQPTIFTDVKPNMRIVKEEIFGPVLVVAKFKDEDDVVAQANDTVYGLASAIFSQNVNRCINVANRIQAGTVWINCYNMLHTAVPFGGYKTSGIGRELGSYALTNYTAVKAVHLNLSAPAPL